jgi:hypothetical protein
MVFTASCMLFATVSSIGILLYVSLDLFLVGAKGLFRPFLGGERSF